MSLRPSERLFNKNLEQIGTKIIKLLAKDGRQAFFVGGFVRNKILKRPSVDIDIATDVTPDEVEKILKRAKIHFKPVGKKFGTILAIADSAQIEITTFRSEGRYSDQRHPDQVEFIKEYLNDAKRRDFTINALYFDPVQEKLYDPTNGQRDLKLKIIRFVGDPKKRIDEDALRMLRGVRLAAQLGFKLEKNSFAAIKTRAKFIQDISGERIKTELDKLLLSDNAGLGLQLLQETGLLKFIIPEFEKLRKVYHRSKTYHLEGDVATHSFKAVEIVKIRELAVIYAALFHDIGKVMKPQKVYEGNNWKYTFKGHVKLSAEIFEKYARKLKFPNDLKKEVHSLILEHDNRKQFLNSTTEAQIKYMLRQKRPELLAELWRVDSGANLRIENGNTVWGTSPAVTVAKNIIARINKASDSFKLASGDLVMKYTNHRPGIELGTIIEAIKVKIVEEKIKNEEDLKNYLHKAG